MKKIIALTSSLLLSVSLYADAPKGAYVGLGFGTSVFNDGGYGDDINKGLKGTGYRVTEDYSDTGAKVYGGYQFNKVVGIEASYTNFGSQTLTSTNGNQMKVNPTSMAIAANLGYSFGESAEYRPFALLGLSYINLDESGEVEAYSSDSGMGMKFGLGFEYTPKQLKGVGFRVAYEGDFFSVTQYTDGINEDTYTQSVSLLYIGASYKF